MTANLFKPTRPPPNVELKTSLQISNGNNSTLNQDTQNAYSNTIGRSPQAISKELRARESDRQQNSKNSLTINMGRNSHQMPSISSPNQQVYTVGNKHQLSPQVDSRRNNTKFSTVGANNDYQTDNKGQYLSSLPSVKSFNLNRGQNEEAASGRGSRYQSHSPQPGNNRLNPLNIGGQDQPGSPAYKRQAGAQNFGSSKASKFQLPENAYKLQPQRYNNAGNDGTNSNFSRSIRQNSNFPDVGGQGTYKPKYGAQIVGTQGGRTPQKMKEIDQFQNTKSRQQQSFLPTLNGQNQDQGSPFNYQQYQKNQQSRASSELKPQNLRNLQKQQEQNNSSHFDPNNQIKGHGLQGPPKYPPSLRGGLHQRTKSDPPQINQFAKDQNSSKGLGNPQDAPEASPSQMQPLGSPKSSQLSLHTLTITPKHRKKGPILHQGSQLNTIQENSHQTNLSNGPVEKDPVEQFAFKTRCGFIPQMRKTNQDSYFIQKDFAGLKGLWAFGVMDGHGIQGHQVSGYVKVQLPLIMGKMLGGSTLEDMTRNSSQRNLNSSAGGFLPQISPKGMFSIGNSRSPSPNDFNESLGASGKQEIPFKFNTTADFFAKQNEVRRNKIINDSFVLTEERIDKGSKIDATFSGTTCVVAWISRKQIVCANSGDSRAIICSQSDAGRWTSKALSRDHKPEEPDEALRIKKWNGRIECSRLQPSQVPPGSRMQAGMFYGPLRVWLKNKPVPGLAMTRSIGDMTAQSVGVTAEPEIKTINKLTKHDKIFVIGSDGLWDRFDNQEVTNLIATNYYPRRDSEGAANHLLRESVERWTNEQGMVDDITIIVAFLDCGSSSKSTNDSQAGSGGVVSAHQAHHKF